MLAALTIAAALAKVRYQVCTFTCADTNATWLSCRAEKCSPRLPEDMCTDGSEPALEPAPSAKEGEGLAVAGPDACAWAGAAPVGSFAERCELCLSLAENAINMARRELSAEELAALGAAGLCERARTEMQSLLPTVRTCRMMPSACDEAVDAWRNATCPLVFEPLTRGVGMSQLIWEQQQACGKQLTQRVGSGVHEAEVCPALRDVGGRVMAISAVVAAALFAAQLTNF